MINPTIISANCLLILFLTLSTSANPVIHGLPLDENGTYSISIIELNNSDFKGEPAYNIEVQTSNSLVDPDENYSMKIFISGVGDAKFGKMRVNIPDYIVKNKNITLKHFYFNYFLDEFNKIHYTKPLSGSEPSEPGVDIIVPRILFDLQDIEGLRNFGESKTTEGEAPFTVNFTISPDAPAGDHNIYIDLFYKNKDKWYLDRQTVPIHVRYWYESAGLQWAVYIALALGALASLTRLNESLGLIKLLKVIIIGFIKIIHLEKFLIKIDYAIKRLIFGPKLYRWIADVKRWVCV